MEYGGPGAQSLSVPERATITNVGAGLSRNAERTVRNLTREARFAVRPGLTPRAVAIIQAGGPLRDTKAA